MMQVIGNATLHTGDCLDVLREMHVDVSEMMACGGGGKSRIWRQMLADMYGRMWRVSLVR